MRMVSAPRMVFLVLGIIACAGTARAADRSALDWSAWQRLPVFDNGRMMPLDTYARTTVEKICHRVSPWLDLEGVSDDQRGTPALAEAGKLFPTGRRQFTASELLFSWLVEPERWETVPFLIAEHEELRKDLLGLPTVSKEGHRLKYVSPWQFEHAPKLQMRFVQLAAAENEAESRGETFQLKGADQKASDLYAAFSLFRLLTFNPQAQSPRRFQAKFREAAATWASANETWQSLQPELAGAKELALSSDPGAGLKAIGAAIEKLNGSFQEGGIQVQKAEPVMVELRRMTADLARQCAEAKEKLFAVSASSAIGEEPLRQVRTHVHALSTAAADLARQAGEMQLALYDSGHTLRLVPGLNAAALLKNRDAGDDAHPWLSIQTLLFAPDEAVRAYSQPGLREYATTPVDSSATATLDRLKAVAERGNPERVVRKKFVEAGEIYVDRSRPDRPERFAAAMGRLAAAVRQTGEGVAKARSDLVRQDPERIDAELLAATAYPPPGATSAEVFYSDLDPFLWSWVISLAALGCFALAFGMARRTMFWLGIAVLAAAQALTIFGFALRVYITGWAPVTNMFETVVFVALVVALLGLSFALQPVLGPGLRNAWRWTAIPGTAEATPLAHDQMLLARPEAWNRGGWLLLVPRLALAAGIGFALTGIHYGEGGYSAVALAPRAMTPNDLIVWAVGMSFLVLAVWLVPRAVLAVLLAVVSIPRTWVKTGLARSFDRAVARKPFGMAAAAVAFLVGYIAYFAPVLDKDINPLMPVLRDNFWLTMHVLTITASYGAGALAWGLGLIALSFYLFGRYRNPVEPSQATADEGHRPAGGYHAPAEALSRRGPEACDALGGFVYKATQVAVLLLAAGTILGGLWADVSWGRFWGWDAKEVWALISLLVYIAVLHGRYAGFLGNFGLAVGSVVGATAILMAWYGVNFVLGSGLHSYGTGAGGQEWVFGFVVLNWLYTAAASVRYFLETQVPPARQVEQPELS